MNISTSPHKHRAYGALALLGIVGAVAGCGSSSKNSASSKSTAAPPPASTPSTTAPATSGASAGQTVKLAASPTSLAFDKKTLTAKAGKVTLVMSNPASSSAPHGIAVEGNGVDKDGKTVPGGGTSTLLVTLKPGKYSFYCPVPGHEKAGMKGILVVQ
jgi:uncharacterized cupredoxin-like copper-binding protein